MILCLEIENMENNLKLRLLSSFVMVLLGLACIFFGNLAMSVFIIFILVVACYEFNRLNSKVESPLIQKIAYIYLFFSFSSVFFLYYKYYDFFLIVTALSFVSDTSAYFIGKKFGKIKCFAFVSPNKTLEGFVGALFVTSIVGYLVFTIFIPDVKSILFIILIPLFAIIGDMVESFLKRKANVKDSGNIIPGQGGILDRIDSVLAVILLTTVYVILFY